MIVLDASVLIAHFDSRDRHHSRAVELLLEAAEHPLGASVLTVAEVLVAPARQRRLDAAEAALRELDVREIALGPNAAARLALLRAETALRLPDCCALLAVQDAAAHALATFDDRLGTEATRRGITVC
ncbi:MAG: type II toxin-antitoxin system VapC family toxin [Solirubrobacteraceae bacterium]